MKKKEKILILGISFLVIVLIGVLFIIKSNSTDAAKFKREYEKINDTEAGDNRYQSLKIPKKNKVKYLSLEEAIDVIQNKIGIIYFGFPNCPWCRGIVPPLLEVIDDSYLENLYYVDMTGKRDSYEIEDDTPIKKEEGAEEYHELVEILDKYLEEYTIKDKNGLEYSLEEKRIYVPMVVAVKDGIVRDAHSGSVELDEDKTPYDALTETQISELKAIFTRLIDSIKDDEGVCDEYC